MGRPNSVDMQEAFQNLLERAEGYENAVGVVNLLTDALAGLLKAVGAVSEVPDTHAELLVAANEAISYLSKIYENGFCVIPRLQWRKEPPDEEGWWLNRLASADIPDEDNDPSLTYVEAGELWKESGHFAWLGPLP